MTPTTSHVDAVGDEWSVLTWERTSSKVVQNNDLVAERSTAPFGWRATSGTFSDAEYGWTTR
ncbi:MAG: hypothetical protein R3F28_03295 [Candidatus Kapaibacterium sp.]